MSNHEAVIQIYINQNINSYTLPTVTSNKINDLKHEDGRDVIFNNGCTVCNDCAASIPE